MKGDVFLDLFFFKKTGHCKSIVRMDPQGLHIVFARFAFEMKVGTRQTWQNGNNSMVDTRKQNKRKNTPIIIIIAECLIIGFEPSSSWVTFNNSRKPYESRKP